MQKSRVYRAIGMMSGTSLDGVDVAMIETDGEGLVRPLAFESYAYHENEREILRAALRKSRQDEAVVKAEKLVTEAHISAVNAFLRQHGEGGKADLMGFHGQTILHDPLRRTTVQIGDAQKLADATGIDVVADMRQADIAAGGQGAPLLPLYHRALAAEMGKPLAIVNIGGVANITWIGPGGEDDIMAFDCGPGNALLDDFVKGRTGFPYDEGGALAREGQVFSKVIGAWMEQEFFHRKPPKSLDRDGWVIVGLSALSDEDGAANLTAFTVCGIVTALSYLPSAPRAVYVTGGGRKNNFMMESLEKALPCPVSPVEGAGWDGDALEAQGFAYLAVRSVRGLPLTLPGTTGVSAPLTGGAVYRVKR